MTLRQEAVLVGAKVDTPLKGVRTNIVQSIRAFRVDQLQEAAQALGHHFLYANLAAAQTKQDVLDLISDQFMVAIGQGKNFDALYDSLTDPVYKAGPQTGFVVVLEHVPANVKFDKEAREQLIDTFREMADYWNDKKIPFRCFYSFSVARAPGAVRALDGVAVQLPGDNSAEAEAVNEAGEKMPTDKLVDVSPLALRMSSPFNSEYWLAAA